MSGFVFWGWLFGAGFFGAGFLGLAFWGWLFGAGFLWLAFCARFVRFCEQFRLYTLFPRASLRLPSDFPQSCFFQQSRVLLFSLGLPSDFPQTSLGLPSVSL